MPEAVFCYHFALTPMKSQELRQAWIDFFVAKGHKPLPSAGLIPDEMSTTLFTIAGMEQFVPVFLGEQPPPTQQHAETSEFDCCLGSDRIPPGCVIR